MRRQTDTTQQKGFTAIEIAMVASVIAILALLILPLFRTRSDEAKLVAARDELQSLAKALLLVEADTGHAFRLQDLDNGITASGGGGVVRPGIDVPVVWSGSNPTLTGVPWVTMNDTERTKLLPASGSSASLIGASFWRGPYISFQKSLPYAFLKAARPEMFVDLGGPIYDVTGGRSYPYPGGGVTDDSDDRIPIDPWGGPYLFVNLAETGYGPRLIYSMGPDGLPGDATPPYVYTSKRLGGDLGNGDDIEYIF